MSEPSDELSMIGGRTGTNIALGGATTPLVSALKIDNEAEGTLDLSTFVFTESEKEYLLGIDTRFEMLAKYLLVNGEDNVDNANTHYNHYDDDHHHDHRNAAAADGSDPA